MELTWRASGEPPAAVAAAAATPSSSLPKGTIFTGTVNIANTILGSGMLAMPFAIANVGLVLGLVMILISGLAATFGLWLLTHVARRLPDTESDETPRVRNPSSFFALSAITYPAAAVYFDAAIAIKCFGVASSYLVVIGDLMPEVVAGLGGEAARAGILGSRELWISAAMAIVTPLAFLKHLNALKYTGMVAMGAVAYLVGIVIYFFYSPDFPITPGDVALIKLGPGFLKALPIFVFAFTCHQNVFSVYNEIKENSQANLNIIFSTSVSAALVIYYVIGTLGYIMYGDTVLGNVIRMYPVIPLVTYGRLALAVLFMFTFPVQAHPCRASLIKVVQFVAARRQASAVTPTNHQEGQQESSERQPLLLPTSPSYASVEQDDPRGPAAAAPTSPAAAAVAAAVAHPATIFSDEVLHPILTTLIVVFAYLVAMSVTSLDRVLAVVGATGSTTIAYILPGLFYYKLYEDMPWTPVKVGAVSMTVSGLLIVVCCLSVQVYAH
ncbi:transmembrane amino acid transporter protein-domain-containing protein [Blastocladiella britannica]|nr:transmembrane amino acid transporter protein-domain-containing protein [Blastocladiella britannica]